MIRSYLILFASRLASAFLRISRVTLASVSWLCAGLLRCDIKCHSVARAEKYQWGPSETQEVRGKRVAGTAEEFKDLGITFSGKTRKTQEGYASLLRNWGSVKLS